jgi:hypothetical protein
MARVFRFGEFTLDTGAFELRRGPAIIPVEPLVLDLLTVMVEQPGVVLSRDRLVESVWKGRIVSESTISTAIKWARKALGDTVEVAETAAAGSRPPIPGGAMQPTVYVRPFETMGEAGLDHLSRALRIRTGSILARVPLLRIASSFPQADQLLDPRELRARFEITHVLGTGSDCCVTMTRLSRRSSRRRKRRWSWRVRTPRSSAWSGVLLPTSGRWTGPCRS